ncbi:molybdopterin-guanine dinucleotide biosynthesis protein B [Lentibacillus salinarum]|uniref:Molybdopterin-guanine dinucleotide biosynthesis protein B n=1 Tax=Lentibacillus salinarum TaxID=446820 RepID=A0ABW3ZPY4_9BACI
MQICQIVGHKNAGKTTVMNQLIRHYSDERIRVGSLKHHGHGGEPDMTDGTDSQQHLESGSLMSGVQGEGMTQLTMTMPFELDDLIQLYQMFTLDILLMEGFKQATYPKIVLLKNEEDLSLLHEVSTIIAVGTWDMNLLENPEYPVFHMNNLQKDIHTIASYIRRGI